MSLFRWFCLAGVAAGCAISSASFAAAENMDRFFLLGAGEVKGIYFPIASEICRSINRHSLAHGWRCGIAASSGSKENLQQLEDGTLTFAVIQSNIALSSSSIDGNQPLFKTVASLHSEPVHLLVQARSSISSLDDLGRALINIGDQSSGTRDIALSLLDAAGIKKEDYQLLDYDAGSQAGRLCDGDVDALIWVSGIRNSSTAEAYRRCDVRLLPIPIAIAAKVMQQMPGLLPIVIPADTYLGQTVEVSSFGPVAQVVASANAPEELVALLTRAIVGDLGDVRPSHPALSNLSQADLRRMLSNDVK
ncbi:TAXI family TRAP transporter solute-binding subunit [Paracoccus liaowanqingii]|uniref:TAXI family TRAP transporter solute-binding subunit n=1 Tax=Paracoccus liaowanqingii TaxID=2560053 RepID=A0A4P7HN69_9RHOB|nr:TAXI family TRAP transporter solute-binding subunit [Paracoccus liaowanqingii]QBX35133.1 TAXI family TRAP transporter solute-binding subunit [Paracoccus liaowanqingii]